MTDPNGWPKEAREAVARAISAADQVVPPGWEGWLQEADAALAALAPFAAAREAAARAAGEHDALLAKLDADTVNVWLAEAERRGMERAATAVIKQCGCAREPDDDNCCEVIAAIRAAAKGSRS